MRSWGELSRTFMRWKLGHHRVVAVIKDAEYIDIGNGWSWRQSATQPGKIDAKFTGVAMPGGRFVPQNFHPLYPSQTDVEEIVAGLVHIVWPNSKLIERDDHSRDRMVDLTYELDDGGVLAVEVTAVTDKSAREKIGRTKTRGPVVAIRPSDESVASYRDLYGTGADHFSEYLSDLPSTSETIQSKVAKLRNHTTATSRFLAVVLDVTTFAGYVACDAIHGGTVGPVELPDGIDGLIIVTVGDEFGVYRDRRWVVLRHPEGGSSEN
jgi:hypothetical protein